MSRVIIEFPESAIFETQLHIDQVYINRGNHGGNAQ